MSKAGSQVVLERRLRPIYDSIDSGNYKKAIQEAEKVLKKHPSTPSAKALKGLALFRSERVNDAWSIINEIDCTDGDMDYCTLRALCHCYKEAGTPDRIVTLYERVCARDPKSEQHLTHLFMGYVRIRNYKMQQKTALTLYREFPKNAYYFWNVMSICMQAISSESHAEQTLLFTLAQKMMEKIMASSKLTTEAECDLYVIILEYTKQYGKAAEFLTENPVFQRKKQSSLLLLTRRIVNLHQMACNHCVVIDRCISELNNVSAYDDWALWRFLFDSMFDVLAVEDGNCKNRKALINRISTFIQSKVTEVNDTTELRCHPRGLYLARFEFISRLKTKNYTNYEWIITNICDPVDGLLNYIKMFCSKPCCFVDIRCYLHLISPGRIKSFTDRIEELTNETSNQETLHRLKIISYRSQCALGCFDCMAVSDRREIVQDMIVLIQKCQVDSMAMGYAVIICYLLWTIGTEHDEPRAFHEIVVFAEWLSRLFALDATVLLIMCRINARFGLMCQVKRCTNELDIKNVQKDTLGYLLLGLQESYGRFLTGNHFCNQLSVFFDHSEIEILESLTTAYKMGKFSNIPHLVQLYSCVLNSLHGVSCDIRTRLISACFVIQKIEHVIEAMFGDNDPIDFDNLRDNRDLHIILPLASSELDTSVEEIRRISFLEQRDYLKLQHLLMKSIASIWYRMRESSYDSNSIVSDLERHYEYCKENYIKLHDLFKLMQAPSPMYLNEYISNLHVDLLIFCIKSAISTVELCEGIKNSMEFIDALKEEAGLLNNEEFSKELSNITNLSTDGITVLNFHTYLRKWSSVLQTLALVSIIIKLIDMVVNDGKLGRRKCKKNKENGRKASIDLRTYFNQRLSFLKEFFDSVLKILNNNLPFYDDNSDYEEVLTDKKADVLEHFLLDYQCSTKGLCEVVESIIKPPWL